MAPDFALHLQAYLNVYRISLLTSIACQEILQGSSVCERDRDRERNYVSEWQVKREWDSVEKIKVEVQTNSIRFFKRTDQKDYESYNQNSFGDANTQLS